MKSLLTRASKLSLGSVVLLLTLIALLFTWQIRGYFQSQSFQQVHRLGEDRLLTYITGIRQTLNRSSHLPYVLSQNLDVRELLLSSGDGRRQQNVNRYLEQTNQIAATARWFVLDSGGQVVASSHWRPHQNEMGRYYGEQPFFYKARDGEVGHYVQLPEAGAVPGYYLSAPIYANLRLIGVAVVMIDLRGLQELWIAAQERLLVSNDQGLIFLSSLPGWRSQWLPGASLPQGAQALPFSWQQQALLDGTRAHLLQGEKEGYLVQSVILDDLRWNVHFLTDLAPLRRQQQTVTLFCIGFAIAIALLALYFRERLLRNLSRRETEALRLRNEAQQRAIISNTQVGLLTVDSRGQVQFINPRALLQFGGREDAVLGQRIDKLLDLDDSPPELQALVESLGAGEAVRPINVLEGTARRLDGGRFPMLISVNPVAWGEVDGYLVTLVDITLRKRAEEALTRANEELEHRVLERTRELHEAQAEVIQSSKLAALGTMSAAIAHELNQPLTAIRTTASSSRLLLERQQLDAVAENLQRMAEMTERMALISSQLKTFAHKRPEQPGAVQLADTIERVTGLFAERIQSGSVRLTLALDEVAEVCGDPPRIEQVLINLIRNGLDSIAAVKPAEADQARLDIRLEADGQGAALSISDSGTGISAEVLEHLFDPFFTTKDVGQGLGLGLSISYGIVRDLQGTIRVQNNPQGGACFRVWLPFAQVPHR